jgi:hypothetical protein
MFSVSPAVDTRFLEKVFRHKVLKMLLSKGKITKDMITLLDKWRHTGFNVFCGKHSPRPNQPCCKRLMNTASIIQNPSLQHLISGFMSTLSIHL